MVKNDRVLPIFEMLFNELEAIILEINQHGAQLLMDEKYSEVRQIIAKVETVFSFRAKLSDLYDEWLRIEEISIQSQIIREKSERETSSGMLPFGQCTLTEDFDQRFDHVDKPNYQQSQIINYGTILSTNSVTLEQVIDVWKEIYENGRSYNEAIEIVASRRDLKSIHTVADKCTRQLGLNTPEFKKLIKEKEKLKNLLIRKFPSDERYIIEELSSKKLERGNL
ncbi:MAG TPA: hypothetical protein DCW42_08060 [Bacteroidetes bacterium]|nr:hypothetical protein [Bacteroidota bacterium]